MNELIPEAGEPPEVGEDAERALTGTIYLRSRLAELRELLPTDQVDPILERTVFEGAPRVEVSQLLVSTVLAVGDLVAALTAMPGITGMTLGSIKECVSSIGDVIVRASALSGLKEAVDELEALSKSDHHDNG